MSEHINAAHLASVSEDENRRGRDLAQRRARHGIKSVRELARQSGVSREGITAAENGTASDATYDRLEAWFDRYEEEIGDDPTDRRDDVVEFQVRGVHGVREIIVKGPISNLPELEAAVARLLKGVGE